MICPNCGKPHEENDVYCGNCKMPIGDAYFTKVDKVAGRGILNFFFVLLFLAILTCGGYYVYNYYVQQAKHDCKADATQIMETYLQADTDNSTRIQSSLEDLIDEKELRDLLSYYEIEVNTDEISNKILENASYRIDGINVTLNKCDVKVTTSNYNNRELFDLIKAEIPDPKEEDDEENLGWWEKFTNWVSDWASDHEESQLPSSLSQWMDLEKEKTSPHEETGHIRYQFNKGKWEMVSVDENIIENLYGFPSEE